jgi:hypothetical protein
MRTLAILLAAASAAPTLAPRDARNIALSEAIVQRVGDRLWPGWDKTPFQIDLLTEGGPVLVNVPHPFTPPNFPTDLEATLTLQTGPIIAIGQPKFTQAGTPIRWSVTLLHEHFHQWQYSWPAYQQSVNALNLSGGSRNGMWMLNYPFPYDNPTVDAAFADLSSRLADALEAMNSPAFAARVTAYEQARSAFMALLPVSDYKYFAFQCWQEGVARYTEIQIAQFAADAHRSDPSFLSDDQANALAQDAAATYSSVLKRLRTAALQQDKRIDFYAVGAGEALLLDRLAPTWHSRYLSPQMDLGAWFVTGSRPQNS